MTRFDDLLDIYDIIQNINIEIKIISIKYIDLLGKGGGGVDETYVLFLPEHTCFFCFIEPSDGSHPCGNPYVRYHCGSGSCQRD